MPVDDANLDTILADLHSKYQAARDIVQSLAKLIETASSIAKTEDPADPSGPRLMPVDPRLGGNIGGPRRQAIYDKVVSDHAAL